MRRRENGTLMCAFKMITIKPRNVPDKLKQFSLSRGNNEECARLVHCDFSLVVFFKFGPRSIVALNLKTPYQMASYWG